MTVCDGASPGLAATAEHHTHTPDTLQFSPDLTNNQPPATNSLALKSIVAAPPPSGLASASAPLSSGSAKMQSSRSIGVASTSGRGSSSSSLAAPQRVRTGRARVARVQAFVDPDSSLATIQTVSQVVTTCCIAAGAFMLLSKPGESLPEQVRQGLRSHCVSVAVWVILRVETGDCQGLDSDWPARPASIKPKIPTQSRRSIVVIAYADRGDTRNLMGGSGVCFQGTRAVTRAQHVFDLFRPYRAPRIVSALSASVWY